MKPANLAVLGLVTLAASACAGSEAAPPTTTAVVAPPTTATTPPTTAPPTTLPATTAAPTPAPPTTTADPAQVLAERHLAFAHVLDKCFSDPVNCDPSTSFTDFVSVDSAAYTFYADAREQLLREGERATQPERIERRIILAELGGDGTGHTVNCIKNAAVFVDAEGAILPSEVGYGREDYFWTQVNGTWVATAATLNGISPEGDGECKF